MVEQNISAGVEAIKENVQVIRAKFQPLLAQDIYIDDVARLLEVVPRMLENVEAMARELNNAFNILNKAPKKE